MNTKQKATAMSLLVAMATVGFLILIVGMVLDSSKVMWYGVILAVSFGGPVLWLDGSNR